MNWLRLFFKRETAAPMLALTFVSTVSLALVVGRILWTGNLAYGFLVWNLFLAWLPLVFALLACEHYRDGRKLRLPFVGCAAAWLLFFPNAPYIFTDLVHLTTRFYGHFWVDLVLILLCALTGLVVGFLSLYLMQCIVAQMTGRFASWIFIAAVAALSGFGIYLGRFLRFNSWDVLTNPLRLTRHVGAWAMGSLAYPKSFAFPVLFGVFVFLSYVMLYALTHTRQWAAPGSGQTLKAT